MYYSRRALFSTGFSKSPHLRKIEIPPSTKVAITGASSYSGRYLTSVLLDDPNIHEIRNLTNHPSRGFPLPDATPARLALLDEKQTFHPFPEFTSPVGVDSDADTDGIPTDAEAVVGGFDEEHNLLRTLDGVDVFFITYWMRFHERKGKKNPALERVKFLADVAYAAGVKRVVYVSHTQPSETCGIPYIEAKALAEKHIRELCTNGPPEQGGDQHRGAEMSYGFLRPCMLFGDRPNESIVANNTAYLMRKLPVFLFPGGALSKPFQPVHVRDLAQMAVKIAFGTSENTYLNAVGPEKFSLLEFLEIIRDATTAGISSGCGRNLLRPNTVVRTRFLELPGWKEEGVFELMRPLNWALGDIYLDCGDLKILGQGLCCAERDAHAGREPVPAFGEAGAWGRRSFRQWAGDVGRELGVEYISSMHRYYDTEKGLL